MDQARYLRLIRGEGRGAFDPLLRLALNVPAAGYSAAVRWRNRRFDRRNELVTKFDVPVISVGNLTLGGTGKTPAVEWIARWYRERDLRVTILSRGYGGSGGLNDEGRVLADNLPDVPHLQDRDRVALARIAIDELDSQLLILDDGFQHRRLGRDLDIVLLDALDPFGLGRIFPRGLLREPVSSLKRAQVVMLSRSNLISQEARTEIRRRAELANGDAVWVESRHSPLDLIGSDGSRTSLDDLVGKRVSAFCGIGNPEGFRRTLAGLGVEPIDFRVFPDHHAYSAADIQSLGEAVETLGVDLVLTTQKDLVKLRENRLGRTPLRALRIGLEITEGREGLVQALTRFLPS